VNDVSDGIQHRHMKDKMIKIDVARSHNHCCPGRAILITYSEFVSVALVIQHVKRMRCIILSSVLSVAVPYFSTLLHIPPDFRETLLNIKCVFLFSLQLWSKTFHILIRTERDIVINGRRSSYKVTVFLFVSFLDVFFEKYLNIKLHENSSGGSPVVPCVRTDKYNGCSRCFFAVFAPKMEYTAKLRIALET
jgi:hypothetical protein